MITAGSAKRNKRVAELINGGQLFPIPWNTLDEVNTIPIATKLKEIMFKYSLPKSITLGSFEKARMKIPAAACDRMVRRTIVPQVIASAAWNERRTRSARRPP